MLGLHVLWLIIKGLLYKETFEKRCKRTNIPERKCLGFGICD